MQIATAGSVSSEMLILAVHAFGYLRCARVFVVSSGTALLAHNFLVGAAPLDCMSIFPASFTDHRAVIERLHYGVRSLSWYVQGVW